MLMYKRSKTNWAASIMRKQRLISTKNIYLKTTKIGIGTTKEEKMD